MEQRFFQKQTSTSSNSREWVVNNGRRLLMAPSDIIVGGLRRLQQAAGNPPAPPSSGTTAAASPPPNSFNSNSGNNGGSGGFQALDPNVVIIMVVLFFALICAALVNSLMRCVLRRRQQAANARAVFIGRAGSTDDHSSEQGLDATTLASLPVLTFKSSETSKPAEVDCTICLSEFTENERLRLLPKCSHVFHLDCIDMWLLSHSSCPICRDGIKADEFALKIMDSESFDSGDMMVLTLDQDGNPSVRRSTGSGTGEVVGGAGGGGGAMEGGENAARVNVRAELKRDKSWHRLSDARLSTSRRSNSLGNMGTSFREGSMSGRVGSSRSSIRAALSAILTSGGEKNSSGRWLASSSSFPTTTSNGTSTTATTTTTTAATTATTISAVASARSSTAERPEGTAGGGSLVVANEQLRARSNLMSGPSH
ncbi:unnamed protein product [Calypogeia fissa]